MRSNTPSPPTEYYDEDEYSSGHYGHNPEAIEIDFDDLDEIEDDYDDQIESNEDIDNYEEADEDDETLGGKPERDDSILTFKKHKKPVFCCAIHPQRNICATGGEDDKAYVWDASTGEVIYEVTNHRDTVIASYFSYDGNYLATGDMAGEIQVFKISNYFKKVWEFSMGDMCWLKWHNATNVLMAGADSGEIYVWRIPSGDCKILPGNGRKCETADLTNDGKKLFAGYGDGTLRLWDIRNCSVIVEVNPTNPISHHAECVSSVSCDQDKSLYLSGSEDGSVLLTSNAGPICTLSKFSGSVEAVAVCPDGDLKIAATGTLKGEIAIWDISKQILRTTCENKDNNSNREAGITTLKWLPEQTLICGTINGDIIGFDGLSGTQKFKLLGHMAEIYDAHFSNRENILLTASEDSTAKIFKII